MTENDNAILIELDARNRVSLSRLAGPHRRFLARVEPGGVIILTPATVVPIGAPADPAHLRACGSGQCTRKVGGSSKYCCAPCANAWESTPRYEVHAHSEGCEQRHRERNPGQWVDEHDNTGPTGSGVTAGPPSRWLDASDGDDDARGYTPEADR